MKTAGPLPAVWYPAARSRPNQACGIVSLSHLSIVNKRTRRPVDKRTRSPMDKRTRSPMDKRTRSPADKRTRSSAYEKDVHFARSMHTNGVRHFNVARSGGASDEDC